MRQLNPANGSLSARIVGFVTGLAGLLLVGAAIAADGDWANDHFLPSFVLSRGAQMGIVNGLRLVLAALGLFIFLFVRPRLARVVRQGGSRHLIGASLPIGLALVAALIAAEAILRTSVWYAIEDRGDREPLGRQDAELGWTLAPNHSGWRAEGGPAINYVTNGLGYRVGSGRDRLDVERPTIVLAGESFLLGYGLPWRDTIAARVGSLTGLQVANISVNAYSTDQIYMRLRRELPRFKRPALVVILFLPQVYGRNLDLDRPYLDAKLRWHPAAHPPLRIVELARRVVSYRSRASIQQGVIKTQAVLRAAIAASASRGARAVIVVPQYRPENKAEFLVRHTILDAGRIPYIHITLDPRWRNAEDRHPDARGAMAIARAIAARLPPSTDRK